MKVGDKVICISIPRHCLTLTYGKEYIIQKTFLDGTIMLVNDKGNLSPYIGSSYFFCSISKFRKMKLEKIIKYENRNL